MTVPARTIKIGRVHDDGPARYQVMMVKNSTEYAPSAWLQPAEVDRLCADHRWDVTIVTLKPLEVR